jgi:hypothetical protein
MLVGESTVLFDGVSIFDVLANQKHQVKQKIESLEQNYVLNASEDDLVAWIVDEVSLDVPALDEPGIHVDYAEKLIDVSRDPMRVFINPEKEFYVPGTQITFIVPFTGDASFFDVQPQHFTYSSAGSRASVVQGEVHFAYAGANLDGERIKREFQNELQLLKQNLQNLKASADGQRSELPQQVREQVRQRKEKLLRDAQMAASIGFPVRRRNGVPATYAVPVQKRTPRIDRPTSPSGPFQPEPALAMEEYENVLSIIRNMVTVMEQSPKAFETMGEEDLRTHFLVQLNAQYEGRATGETFNFQGKTDILIRADGRNVFIAECKFWAGEKQFLETIDQLLSYLSWRDTKTAVLIFNRNVNFSEVLRKITDSVVGHSCYKRTLQISDESTFRYVFHQTNDENRELTLSVIAFDVPVKS